MNVKQIKSYLAAINFPCDLNQLPANAYLVGGSVRDALLQRFKVPVDLDVVVPIQAIEIAQEIAHRYQAGFVVLDAAREISRVVFQQGTLDIALQVGESILRDLDRRDFTINAIAYNFHSQSLVDPHQGLVDLKQKTIRMVDPSNLEDDPLRLLRAYRQAAQLKFTIDVNTRRAIRDRSYLIKKIAAERIQAELNYLLLAPQGNQWLAAATEDGLLQVWLPSINQTKIDQLEAVAKAVKTCLHLGLKHSEFLLLTKLATLVAIEATIAETELTQLKYSRAQIKAVTTTVQYLPQLQDTRELMSLRSQYFWFLAIKNTFPILIARAIAMGIENHRIYPLIRRYVDPNDPVAHPQPLVTGTDLLRELNLSPCPLIGKLLTAIQLAHIEAKIFTPEQAIDFAQNLIANSSELL